MATTTGHERSKALSNFSLPNLWGTRRQLRCMKAADDSDGGSSSGGDQRLRRRSSNSELDHRNRRSQVEESSEKEGIEEFREKIMLDLRNVADKMTESIFREQFLVGDDPEPETETEMEMEMEDSPPPPPEAPGETVEVRPWNLRKRRAACKAPVPRVDSNQYKGLGVEENKRVVKDSVSGVKMRFEDTLSKKEIEDDYMKIFGQRPPRRPKKRSRTVQRQIDLLNPASYITEITEELYNVRDQAERGKR
ncbi:PREDICTED: uncharacterized protein LOC104701455 isoform X2 [Camelina sativa]|uniref:Uncharacterized protein LOC104701455 isoform X2 n=1 Tax=Camelina sativa TaxID=90675 RepID=A0ABM0SSC7_CAMSA|nr:PREDICTED: uncharacterized protein LOC104701455 isoform X2 [Camelina sativa]